MMMGKINHARHGRGKAMITTFTTREEWLEARKNGIGSTDAAAILGLNRWRSPLAVYAEKIGAVEPYEESEAMIWGRRLQRVILDQYSEETKRPLIPWPENQIAVSEIFPFALASLDAEASEQGKGSLVVEAKTAGAYTLADWQEEPPLLYQIQVQHQLLVMGYEWASIAVLIGGNKFFWCDLPRNDDFLGILAQKEEAFWQRVETRDPPEVDATESTARALQMLYPKDQGKIVDLPEVAAIWDKNLQDFKQAITKLEGQKREVENAIKASIGEATYGRLPDGSGYCWKHQHKKAFTIKEQDRRVLNRVTKIKEG